MSETEIRAVPTEAEMSSFRNIFEKVAMTITEAAGLQAAFASMRVELDSLKRDLEEVRDRNRWLDKELNEIRQARDSYRQQKYELENAVAVLKTDNDLLNQTIATLRTANESQQSEIVNLVRDRDDAQLKAMELEDKVASLTGQLEIIKDFARSNFDLVEKPVAIPQVTPTPTPLAAEPSQEAVSTSGYPAVGSEEYNKLPWWEQDKIVRAQDYGR